VVLLVAGCGGGGSDKETGAAAPSSGSSAPARAGAEAEGGSLDAAAVTKEIGEAATAAGFTKKPSDDVPPALKSCMVDWAVDSEKATDAKKSYDDTVAALAKNGWKESRSFDQKGSVIKSLDKGGWTLKASHHGQGGFVTVMFIATDSSPACEKLFQEDLEKSKNTQ
jgi:predicted RNA binding protein YcfA (HicA-like mRNA interferase family)